MMKAFVLVALDGNHEREVMEQLKSFDEVKQAYLLFGEWDILAEVELENAEALGAFVMDNIRSDERVKLTSSLIVAGQ
jgi:DNA-binding Lrp family transcriptional regulator